MLVEYLEALSEELATRYGFDPTNGWNQVTGSDRNRTIEYGRFSMLQDLLDEFQ
jgi:hypothetical protein